MPVGEKIKKYLESQELSQIRLSEETGISAPKLNLTLNGKRKMTFEEYELICGALKVSTSTFLKPKKPNETQSKAS